MTERHECPECGVSLGLCTKYEDLCTTGSCETSPEATNLCDSCLMEFSYQQIEKEEEFDLDPTRHDGR